MSHDDDNGRKAGSGLGGDAAAAVEELIAAHFRGDATAIARQLQILKGERQRGHCGIDPPKISKWIGSLVSQVNLPIATARRALPGNPGDVEAVLTDGTSRWIEVKAQTKKAGFDDLTQADWIRDGTDALAWLAYNDAAFRRQVGSNAVKLLKDRVPSGAFQGGFQGLWLADVALITSAADRAAAGVTSEAALHAFLKEKYLLQVTQAGARLALLGSMPPVQAAMDGSQVSYQPKKNRVSLISIPVTSKGSVSFTYHLYQSPVPGQLMGRHKLHARTVQNTPGMLFAPKKP